MIPVLKLSLPQDAEKAFRRFLGTRDLWQITGFSKPPTRTLQEYALALFVKTFSFYGWSYRTVEAVLGIPRSTLH